MMNVEPMDRGPIVFRNDEERDVWDNFVVEAMKSIIEAQAAGTYPPFHAYENADAFIRERRMRERQTTSWASMPSPAEECRKSILDAARTLRALTSGASRIELVTDGFSVIIDPRYPR